MQHKPLPPRLHLNTDGFLQVSLPYFHQNGHTGYNSLINQGNSLIIFKETIDRLVLSFHNVMNSLRPEVAGGGIIGGGFAILFDKLFSFIHLTNSSSIKWYSIPYT